MFQLTIPFSDSCTLQKDNWPSLAPHRMSRLIAAIVGNIVPISPNRLRTFRNVPPTSALPPKAASKRTSPEVREWDGPAALPPPTALRVRGGLSGEGAPPCLAHPPFTQ